MSLPSRLQSACAAASRLVHPLPYSPLLVAACGGSEAVKPAKLRRFQTHRQTRVAWRASVGRRKALRVHPRRCTTARFSPPAMTARVARLDAANGKQIWRVDTGQKLSGGVGADAGMVLVAARRAWCSPTTWRARSCGARQVTSEVLARRARSATVIVRQRRRPHFRARRRQRRAQMGVSGRPCRRCCCAPNSGLTPLRELVLAGLPGRQAGRAQPEHRELRSGTPWSRSRRATTSWSASPTSAPRRW